MSDLSYNIFANVNRGDFAQQLNVTNRTASMSTAGMLSVTLQLGTTTQAISTASAVNLGYALARSLVVDTTGTSIVSFGRVSGTTLFDTVRLKPGDAAWFRLAPGNYAARGATDNSPFLIQILED